MYSLSFAVSVMYLSCFKFHLVSVPDCEGDVHSAVKGVHYPIGAAHVNCLSMTGRWVWTSLTLGDLSCALYSCLPQLH